MTPTRLSLVALVAFLIACGTRSDSAGGRVAASESTAIATSALRVGEAVPLYEATALSGGAVSLGGQADSITLVNVWATWCTSCREEMQDLEQLHRAYATRGVRVVAVSLDAGSEQLVRRFVGRERLSFAVVHDREARLQALYHVGGVPSTYLIGRDGTLLWQRTGGLHGVVDQARLAIDAVTGPLMSQAR